ncbi:MAG: methyltransferase domain-containing protein [Chloroflexota bacterium]|jgi:SAM-dependent methyltransferase
MSRIARASLATITILGLAGVVLRLSGYGARLATALERWEVEHQHWFFDGPIGRAVARGYAPLVARLYAAYAQGLQLQPEDEVLDVACGSGVFLAHHAKHARRIAGLDQSRAMIDQARKENRGRIADGTAEFALGDAAALPWDDETFTVVTSNDVSCYESKAAPAIREMYRVLRPGGRAVVSEDRRRLMEAAGFAHACERQIAGMQLTIGYKAAYVPRHPAGRRADE